MGLIVAIAFVWGFAEATLFFIVADVLITIMAVLYGLQAGVLGALAACVGALPGGMLMYRWGKGDAERARELLDDVPAISREMIAGVRRNLENKGLAAMISGAFSGVPYKVYAVEAGALSLPMPRFLGMSIVARLARFLPAGILAALVAAGLRLFIPESWLLWLLGVFWVVFYVIYFTRMKG